MLSLNADELLHLKQIIALRSPVMDYRGRYIMMNCCIGPKWNSSGAEAGYLQDTAARSPTRETTFFTMWMKTR